MAIQPKLLSSKYLPNSTFGQSYRLNLVGLWFRVLGVVFRLRPGDFRVLFSMHQQALHPATTKSGLGRGECNCNILHQLLELVTTSDENSCSQFINQNADFSPYGYRSHCALRSNPALFLFRRGKTRLTADVHRLSSFPLPQ